MIEIIAQNKAHRKNHFITKTINRLYPLIINELYSYIKHKQPDGLLLGLTSCLFLNKKSANRVVSLII